MLKIGQFNKLTVLQETPFGLYLDGQEWGEVFLPNRQIPKETNVGDDLNVFIYLDSEEKITATTIQPKAQVNCVAFLKVVDVNHIGAFLDWGLDKDLLAPKPEQRRPMEKGRSYLVYVSLDRDGRIIASSKIERFMDKSPASYALGDEVDIFIAEKSDLAQKSIINHNHWGLIHASDIYQDLHVGQRMKAYIKKIRADGKIDISLRKMGQENIQDLSAIILDKLKAAGGFLALHDKSSPAEINNKLAASKKSFKSAIGALYKRGQIRIEQDGIHLKDPQ